MVVLAVVVTNWPYNLGRNPDSDHVSRQVLGDNRTGPDYGIITNCDPGNNNDAGPEPAVFTNVDRQVILVALFP